MSESDNKGKFVVGDVVRLRSGSPAMTITNVSEENGCVDLLWFDEVTLRSILNVPAACMEEDQDGF